MGQEHGWTNHGMQVFDPQLLEEAAAELRNTKSPQELRDLLLEGLVPGAQFGRIGGATGASARLAEVYESITAELEKVGIDLTDLALRTLAAAKAARWVDQETRSAARRAL
jgi:hypothetical protein